MYEGNGGVLTRSAEFGYDPLIHRRDQEKHFFMLMHLHQQKYFQKLCTVDTQSCMKS